MSVFHHTPAWKRVASRFKYERLAKDTWHCAVCGFDGRWVRLEVDHIKPLSEGGKPYDFANLQPLCIDCHISKTKTEREKPCAERQQWIDAVGF